ncbi:MAG TPA: hypothetical protein ENJ95_12380 [Bacteroidetes bacterium]|nr:hypothetical protein [Bacteroidota bacterium]
MEKRQPVRIATFGLTDNPSLDLFEALLRNAGIAFEVRGKYGMTVNPIRSAALGGVGIYVDEDDAAYARELFMDFQKRNGIGQEESKAGNGCIIALVLFIVLFVIGMLFVNFG